MSQYVVYDFPGIITCLVVNILVATMFWFMYPFGSEGEWFSHRVAYFFLTMALFTPWVGICKKERLGEE